MDRSGKTGVGGERVGCLKVRIWCMYWQRQGGRGEWEGMVTEDQEFKEAG